MELNRIKSITDKNIDRIINENLYRGHEKTETILSIQCMDKDIHVTFNFEQEEATINNYHNGTRKTVFMEFMAPKLIHSKLQTFC